jgi:hypothetical protein
VRRIGSDVRDYLDRLQPADATLFATPKILMRLAEEFHARARARGFGAASLKLREREIAAAASALKWCSACLDQAQEFVHARNVMHAVFNGRSDVVDCYTREILGLRKRRLRAAAAEAIFERRWLEPPGCTHITRYIRNRAWQIVKDQQRTDEGRRHGKTSEQKVTVSNLGYDELHGMVPARLAMIDLRVDLEKTLDAIGAPPEFCKGIKALVFDGAIWSDLAANVGNPDAKHFATSFRRKFQGYLRQFEARMSAYLVPPLRRGLEERMEAEARNRPAALARLSETYYRKALKTR